MKYQIAYVKNAAWHLTQVSAKTEKLALDLARISSLGARHMIYTGTLGPQATLALRRPSNYFELPGEEQWNIDKALGILDWSGDITD